MKFSVVVANHGRDISMIRQSVPKHIEFIEIDVGKERSEQRNMGIELATGDAILILDSDQSVDPRIFHEARQLFQSGFTSLYIPEIIIAKSFFGKIRKFEREFYTATAIDVPRFVMKSACPKFDPTMSGPEDADWGNRIPGYRATTHYPLYHHDDISIWEYFKKKAYYTKSMNRYKEKWPDDKCLNFKYRCWTVFTEKGKWKKLIRHPILTLGIMFIVAIRGIIYVGRKRN